MRLRTIVALGASTLMMQVALAQMVSILNSPHDLSAGSGRSVRASVEDQVCVFCHTPHNASPVGALWNRSLSPQAYTPYSSPSLRARPGQPTGASKFCLSCHDGTIALGSLLNRELPLPMSGGVGTMPQGASNLGTDLRDDHPISFAYDSMLASQSGILRDPGTLPHEMKLDSNGELQCTTCHDAHNNAYGKFLALSNAGSQVCTTCHNIGRTNIEAHTQCDSCHQPHSAPSGAHLLRQSTVSGTCLACHGSNATNATNVGKDVSKAFTHVSGKALQTVMEPENQTSCTSCHDPHSMMDDLRNATALRSTTEAPASLGRLHGVNLSGSPVVVATAEHEVCFKCHTEGLKMAAIVPRKRPAMSTRAQFAIGAVSRHPVGSPSLAVKSTSLKAEWSSATMQCSDCHGSDDRTVAGVHGSNFKGLLVARYELGDRTSESADAYALCYKCHDRASILDNRSFPGHRSHVVDQRTPCSACHDSHGIGSSQGSGANNGHLINFATSIVQPDRVTGRLEYRDLSGQSGQCYLTCHGVDHSPKQYPIIPSSALRLP